MENRKKGMISKLDINKQLGLNYEGILEFRVGEKIFNCTNINTFIKDILMGNIIKYEMFLDKLYGVDFRVYSYNEDSDGIITFEIQIIDDSLNRNKVILLLKGKEIK